MLSIIIPTLNEEKYLPRLLTHLQHASPRGSEIIVSDGQSKDATVSIARKFGCTVVVTKRRAPAIQRNVGARMAKGDVLFFIDADTQLPDGFFSKALGEFEKRHLDVASFYFTLHSKKLLYCLASFHGYIMMYLVHFFHPIGVGAALLARKTAHDEIGGFDETIRMGEDHVYCKTMAVRHKYGLIRSTDILFSVRRFEKEGPWKVAWKWYYLSFYYLFHGPIRTQVVPYEFGKY